jgi:hypothetical protein
MKWLLKAALLMALALAILVALAWFRDTQNPGGDDLMDENTMAEWAQ